jgi:hypothetical protein
MQSVAEARKKIVTIQNNPPTPTARITTKRLQTVISAELVKSYIKHPVLKALAENCVSIMNDAKNGDISKDDAIVLISAQKNLINLMVLDKSTDFKDAK